MASKSSSHKSGSAAWYLYFINLDEYERNKCVQIADNLAERTRRMYQAVGVVSATVRQNVGDNEGRVTVIGGRDTPLFQTLDQIAGMPVFSNELLRRADAVIAEQHRLSDAYRLPLFAQHVGEGTQYRRAQRRVSEMMRIFARYICVHRNAAFCGHTRFSYSEFARGEFDVPGYPENIPRYYLLTLETPNCA